MPGDLRFTPSPEQQAVVDLCATHNVVVSARPGSGKTTTAAAIVVANPTRSVVVLTYSKRLQIDTAIRLGTYGNNDAFTFHALACHLFGKAVYNDFIMRELRLKGTIPPWRGTPYEIIILDEIQDCTDDLFWLICAFITSVTAASRGRYPRLVVLGDERQAIYAFKGADARYLTLASSTMATLTPFRWSRLTLSTSFRLSHENAAFVNRVFLKGENCIVGSHSGPKPLYLHGDIFDEKRIVKHILPLIQQYGPENTAVLAPSVRPSARGKKTPLQMLTNHLAKDQKIPVADPLSDDGKLNDQALHGKVCISTYHQFKGNERDLVVVYGIDASYFKMLGKDFPDDCCPNQIFVALTRACKQLVIVHSHKADAMPFVDIKALLELAQYPHFPGRDGKLKAAKSRGPQKTGLNLPQAIHASDLARHVREEVVHHLCNAHLEIHTVARPLPDNDHIDAPDVVLTDPARGHSENVSDLNGLAVVAAYEYAMLGTLTTFNESRNKDLTPPLPSNTAEQAIWLCRKACHYSAGETGYEARRVQMAGHSFDWLGKDLEAARTRLAAEFPKDDHLEFETHFHEKDFTVANAVGGTQKTELVGIADIIQTTSIPQEAIKREERDVFGPAKLSTFTVTIWEIKFVAQLSNEHIIQACVYAYLYCQKYERAIPPKIILFNVRNGEKWEIVPRRGVASLRAVVEETIIAKHSMTDPLSNAHFLEKCAETRSEVGGNVKMEDVTPVKQECITPSWSRRPGRRQGLSGSAMSFEFTS